MENECGLNKKTRRKLGFFVHGTQSLQSPTYSGGKDPTFVEIKLSVS